MSFWGGLSLRLLEKTEHILKKTKLHTHGFIHGRLQLEGPKTLDPF